MANLSIEIAEELQKKIVSGIWPEGQRVTSERSLSEQYKVSRNVIREALCVLSEKGLVEIHPGKGAYVTSPKSKTMDKFLEVILDQKELRWLDIIEAREAIELAAVECAARNATHADLALLNNLYRRMNHNMDDCIGDNIQFSELDSAFHQAIAKASGNAMFELLLNIFYRLIDEHSMFGLGQFNPQHIKQTQIEHLNILQAIQEKAPQKARIMLQTHFDSLRTEINSLASSD